MVLLMLKGRNLNYIWRMLLPQGRQYQNMKPRDHRLLDNISNHSSLSHIKSRAFDECKATEIQTSEEKSWITPQLELEMHYATKNTQHALFYLRFSTSSWSCMQSCVHQLLSDDRFCRAEIFILTN